MAFLPTRPHQWDVSCPRNSRPRRLNALFSLVDAKALSLRARLFLASPIPGMTCLAVVSAWSYYPCFNYTFAYISRITDADLEDVSFEARREPANLCASKTLDDNRIARVFIADTLCTRADACRGPFWLKASALSSQDLACATSSRTFGSCCVWHVHVLASLAACHGFSVWCFAFLSLPFRQCKN